jgi:RES domain-containing protein
LALDVDVTAVRGRWFRDVPAGIDPSRRPVPPPDNRWQRGHVVDALYLADSAACVWAEWYRHLAERGLPPRYALPRDLWRYDVAPLELADLGHPDPLARLGLPLPRPGRRTWPEFQEVGEQLHREGWRGLIAPSAARPRDHVLVVFLPDPAIPVEVVATSYTRVSELPTPPTNMRT